ncbi:Succinate dehydrogenase flavoprotein subunit [Nymphon striatum]|nr:Succinate dehydrogenase flavoprotein subunit [Nymphon striatum]
MMAKKRYFLMTITKYGKVTMVSFGKKLPAILHFQNVQIILRLLLRKNYGSLEVFPLPKINPQMMYGTAKMVRTGFKPPPMLISLPGMGIPHLYMMTKYGLVGGRESYIPGESERKNDVWYSENGIDWVQATPNAAFAPRAYHTSVVYKKRMWVLGGNWGSNTTESAWCSKDGITWEKATQQEFLKRHGHTTTVFDNKMWVINGHDGYTSKNDIWVLEHFVIKILQDVRIPLRHKEELMQQKIIKVMATVTTVFFTIPVKGGDYRSREANVYRLAEVSANIIDQCVAQGVPFAREYGGLLDNRSFGGVLVSRTFYAKGQTGQQLLLGAYSAMNRQINRGKIQSHTRHEMMDLVKVDGKARGIIARNLVTGEIERHSAHAVVLATGGYGNVFFLSTNAMGSNVMAAWRAHRKGAFFANPCYTQIHPTCIPVSGDHQSKLTLMSESLRNDGRIWVPKRKEDAVAIQEGKLKPLQLKEEDRDYYLERRYPAFGNLVPRDVASRAAKERCDAGFGVNKTGEAVYLDFTSAIQRYGKEQALTQGLHNADDKEVTKLGKAVIEAKYGNLFQMYEKIVDENPYETPMMIYPAVHYTMGGLWVDYNLQTTVEGCYAAGEANFSDHGANRLGASALMQGLADGYFVLPYTIGDYLSNDIRTGPIATDSSEFDTAEKEVKARLDKLMGGKGLHSVDSYHKKLGKIMWNKCGMSRNAKELQEAIDEISALRADFWENVKIPGIADGMNQELEKAGRVADFLELGELFAKDALTRNESCGGHFREEYQTPEGEAMRD